MTILVIRSHIILELFSAHVRLPWLEYSKAEKSILNSDGTIFLPMMGIKNLVENVDWIFLKTTDQPYCILVKIVLIMHNKYSQAYIAHNSVYHSYPEQHTRKNWRVQINRWVTRKHSVPIVLPKLLFYYEQRRNILALARSAALYESDSSFIII